MFARANPRALDGHRVGSGIDLGEKKTPLLSVCSVRAALVSTSVAVTSASVSAAPVRPVTVPEIALEVPLCAEHYSVS